MKELMYPFDSAFLLKNKKKIRRKLMEEKVVRIKKEDSRSRRLDNGRYCQHDGVISAGAGNRAGILSV